MSFNSNSKSKSASSSSHEENSIQKIRSIEDLENIIKTAKDKGVKKITVKDYRSSPLKLSAKDLFGNTVSISPFPSKENVFTIEFV